MLYEVYDGRSITHCPYKKGINIGSIQCILCPHWLSGGIPKKNGIWEIRCENDVVKEHHEQRKTEKSS